MGILNIIASSGTGASSYLDSQFITDVGTLLTTAVSWITGNAYLKLFLTAGLIMFGVHMFNVLKQSVRV